MKKYFEPDVVKQSIPLEPIPKEVLAKYLRPGELIAIQEKFPVVFLPLGTIEWHGRHNPLGCDSIKAERLCEETAKRIGGVVMPAIYFAVDAYWDVGQGYGYGMDPVAGFQLPGSFYQAEHELMKPFLINACKNYLSRGFKLVVLVSGHNPPIQQALIDEVCYTIKTPEGKEPVVAIMEVNCMEGENILKNAEHGGGYETSMMLYLANEKVNIDASKGQEVENLALFEDTPFKSATAEEGENRFMLQIDGLSKFVMKKYEALLK